MIWSESLLGTLTQEHSLRLLRGIYNWIIVVARWNCWVLFDGLLQLGLSHLPRLDFQNFVGWLPFITQSHFREQFCFNLSCHFFRLASLSFLIWSIWFLTFCFQLSFWIAFSLINIYCLSAVIGSLSLLRWLLPTLNVILLVQVFSLYYLAIRKCQLHIILLLFLGLEVFDTRS